MEISFHGFVKKPRNMRKSFIHVIKEKVILDLIFFNFICHAIS